MGFRNGKPSKQFTAIPNSLIRDNNLTDSTFRLICWVASHDENFDISFTVIEKHLGYKRDKIRNAIKNAEQNDYLVRVQEHNPNNGKFDWQYYIFTNKDDTKLFRENHSSISGSSKGGSSVGGSPIGGLSNDGLPTGGFSNGGLSNVGASTPHIEKQLEEKQLEEKHIQKAPPKPGAPPTQECVCEEKSELTSPQNQDQPTPKSLTSLFTKPESLPQILDQPNPKSLSTLFTKPESSSQTENLSSRLSIAAGSFAKNELSNKDPYKSAQNVKELIEAWITDPTTFASDCVPVVVREKIKWSRWVLPWRSRERKLHPLYQNFNPIVVDLVAVELASSASCTKDEKITHAVSVMNTWEKTKGGWTNLMQRYQQALNQQQRHTPPTTPNPTAKANISLAQAIAQDEQRHQQELSSQSNSALPQHTSETLSIKEKLFQRANSQKTRTSSTLSASALLEVEAQLKQALGA